MTIEELVAAFALPSTTRVGRRVPKTILSERGATSAADRKLIDRSVDRLDWIATLSPSTAGMAASDDPDRPTPEIQVLALTTKTEPVRRLFELVHRAIPYPITLIVQSPDGQLRMSLAPLRPAERIANQLVVDKLALSPLLNATDRAFLESLNLDGLPRTDLGRLYSSLVDRVEALTASRLSGAGFRLPNDPAETEARRQALAEHSAKEIEWIAAKAAARKEKRLAHQVRLSAQATSLKNELAAIAARLA